VNNRVGNNRDKKSRAGHCAGFLLSGDRCTHWSNKAGAIKRNTLIIIKVKMIHLINLCIFI
jgi:hypothetical protein